jgi:hypothetical protein
MLIAKSGSLSWGIIQEHFRRTYENFPDEFYFWGDFSGDRTVGFYLSPLRGEGDIAWTDTGIGRLVRDAAGIAFAAVRTILSRAEESAAH